MKHVLILGNGIAGITAARYIRKTSDHRITVVSAESDHFFSRTALMYIYMGHLTFADTKPYEDWFWKKNRIDLVRAKVISVDFNEKSLLCEDRRRLTYDVLILATGSTPNKFGWKGQDLPGVQGLYHLQDLEDMEQNTRGIPRAVVVGGGLIGVEMAEMLSSRNIPVTFLVREKCWMDHVFPPQESELINRHLRAHGVDLRLGGELDEIVPGADGRVTAVVTRDGERIPCGFVGLTVGVRPNIDFLRHTDLACDRGILVDELLRTNQPDVYAIGDCAQVQNPQPGRQAVEPLWYVGRTMGQAVARTICEEPTPYVPGQWFNSAKFFDLEWQVYGQVPALTPAGVRSLYWEHPKGGHAIRVNYAEEGPVLGVQVMGIRYRHDVCHAWIESKSDIRFVLRNLGAANFDPELYPQFEQHLIDVYNRQHPEAPVTLERKRGLWGALQSMVAAGARMTQREASNETKTP